MLRKEELEFLFSGLEYQVNKTNDLIELNKFRKQYEKLLSHFKKEKSILAGHVEDMLKELDKLDHINRDEIDALYCDLTVLQSRVEAEYASTFTGIIINRG